MKPLLMIMNPRSIPETTEAYKALDIDKAWLTGYTEDQLVGIVAQVIGSTDYTHYVMGCDDSLVRPRALQSVLDAAEYDAVVTGWANITADEPWVNLTSQPLGPVTGTTVPELYPGLYHWTDVVSGPALFRTYISGFSLTTMSREFWLRFPFEAYSNAKSDHCLCWRLQEAGIPITAVRDAFVKHLKGARDKTDQPLFPQGLGQEVRYEAA